MRAIKYLFFIETKDGKTIYAVKKKNDVYHTVDIYENESIKQDFTVANGTIEKALEYGIYKCHHDESNIKEKKTKIINKAMAKRHNIKDNLPQPSKA